MVQWLADPASSHAAAQPRALPPKRPARRGYSVTDFQGDAVPDFLAALSLTTAPPPSSSSTTHIPTEASIPENAVLRTTPAPQQTTLLRPPAPPPKKKHQPPRRSYSATDKEPEDAVLAPNHPRPAAAAPAGGGCWGGGSLLALPPELLYALLDFLDPIDAACLGLAHPALYAVHRRKTAGRNVPLSSRYHGPNDLEWVWRGVRHLHRSSSASSPSPSPSPEQTPQPLDKLRVKGQVYCRKCGIARCELHRHIRGWMGDGYQYCEIKERFCRPAPEGARSYCFMSSPKDRNRCGRHGNVLKPPTPRPEATTEGACVYY